MGHVGLTMAEFKLFFTGIGSGELRFRKMLGIGYLVYLWDKDLDCAFFIFLCCPCGPGHALYFLFWNAAAAVPDRGSK